MQYSWLKCFYYVAICSSVTRAASVMGLTPPTVSVQLKNIEEFYSVLIFTKKGKTFSLTPFGERLFILCKHFFETEDKILELFAEDKHRLESKINFAASNPQFIMSVIGYLNENSPNLKFNLKVGNFSYICEALSENKVDMASASIVDLDDIKNINTEIDVFPIYNDRLVAIVDTSSSLAKLHEISLNELLTKKLLLREKDSATRRVFDKFCNKVKSYPNNYIEIATREGLKEAVVHKLGVGIALRLEAKLEPRLSYIHITHPKFSSRDTRVTKYLLVNRQSSSVDLVRNFIKAMEKIWGVKD